MTAASGSMTGALEKSFPGSHVAHVQGDLCFKRAKHTPLELVMLQHKIEAATVFLSS